MWTHCITTIKVWNFAICIYNKIKNNNNVQKSYLNGWIALKNPPVTRTDRVAIETVRKIDNLSVKGFQFKSQFH